MQYLPYSDLFHLEYYPEGPSMLSQVAGFPSSSWLNNISLWMYTQSSLSVHLSIYVEAVSTSRAIVSNAAMGVRMRWGEEGLSHRVKAEGTTKLKRPFSSTVLCLDSQKEDSQNVSTTRSTLAARGWLASPQSVLLFIFRLCFHKNYPF